MPAGPLISAVITNYNYGRYLDQAIESVLAQTYAPVEIVVVDDGSTDDSEAVVHQYGARVRWVAQSHRGVSAARNRGIQESRGEAIAFLDADDVWHANKLARQVTPLSNPEVGMVYCGLQYLDAMGRPLGTSLSGRRGRVLKDIALLQGPGVPASGSSAVVRRACFERLGLFDEALSTSADWDMWRRIACHYEIEIVAEPLFFYRLHGSSMHRQVSVMEQDMLRAFAKAFADPAAAEIHPFRRRGYSKLYLMLGGSYLQAGRVGKCLAYVMRSVCLWPPSVGYVASFPMRRLRQWWVAHASPL